MSEKSSFFSELKRRNVIRTAILYVGAVWALAQGIAQLGHNCNDPGFQQLLTGNEHVGP